MDVLKETNAGNLGQKKAGKVRDIYDQGDKLILITTDRHSSFDRIIAHIPWKGQVLNQVSAWWFEQTKAIVSNQVLEVPDPNVMVVRKYKIVPVEAVMRGYLTGVTDTSIWTRYQKGIRQFDDLNLPDGMNKNEKLPKSVFDPATKEEKHDRGLTPEELIKEGFLTQKLFDEVKATATSTDRKPRQIAVLFSWTPNTNSGPTSGAISCSSMRFIRLIHHATGSSHPTPSA